MVGAIVESSDRSVIGSVGALVVMAALSGSVERSPIESTGVVIVVSVPSLVIESVERSLIKSSRGIVVGIVFGASFISFDRTSVGSVVISLCVFVTSSDLLA